MIGRGRLSNADFPWDEFDSAEYFAHNYGTMRDDDRQILTFVRDFLVQVGPELGDGGPVRGIDVGTGPNLYPALTMLPFCDDITLYEYSRSNVDWLRGQHAAQWPTWATSWHEFWNVLCDDPAYAGIDRPDMGVELSRRTKVVWGDVFDLGVATAGRYDIGTMFFGPESLSPRESEFQSAIHHLLDVLRPNAPFVIALMEHSKGYWVDDQFYPATDVDLDEVNRCLADRASGLSSMRVDIQGAPIRDGYSGMMVVCGRVTQFPD
jgi:hypothetical protein